MLEEQKREEKSGYNISSQGVGNNYSGFSNNDTSKNKGND